MRPPPRFWYESWPPHLPCSVEPQRAIENAEILTQLLGRKWIDNAILRGKTHPLINEWRFGGEQAFLRLNTLAEDLRVLRDTPGIASLLKDLKGQKSYAPALHTLHAAALFARAGNPLRRFFAPGNTSVPDFELTLDGRRAPVEAKQLTQSEPERNFGVAAQALQTDLIKALFGRGGSFPELHIILKDPTALPRSEVVIEAARGALERYGPGLEVFGRFESFNIRVLASRSTPSLAEQYTIQILAPRHDKEDERIERLINKANKQLKNNTQGAEPALVCLAIGTHQDPHAVVALIRKKFAAGDFRSTSGVIIHRFARHAGPGPIATADLLRFEPNPLAHAPLPTFRLEGTGVTGDLVDDTPIDASVSCYGVGVAMGKPGNSNASIGFNPIFRVNLSDLA